MSNFNESFYITLGHEGGYSNDPVDVGGETYRGISRRYHPCWRGWVLIDELKSDPRFPNILSQDEVINGLVKDFYKETFWDLFWGDEIPDQGIANELFDTGVNMGVSRSVKYLQIGLNVLNRNQKNYPDIVEDGVFGQNTMNALNSYLHIDDNSYILKIMNVLQGMHYIEYMRKSPIQERFARGWFNRVSITKD